MRSKPSDVICWATSESTLFTGIEHGLDPFQRDGRAGLQKWPPLQLASFPIAAKVHGMRQDFLFFQPRGSSRLAGIDNAMQRPIGTSPPAAARASVRPGLVAADAAPPVPAHDAVELGGADDAKFQKMKRLGTDSSLLILGDVPAGISVAVGLNALPALTPFSPIINAVNALTGYLGLASDLSVARDCISNPDAKRLDKIVDAAHIGSDLINTGSSMVPLFTSLSNPIALGIFVGGQAFGATCDLAKLVWDYKRGGEQSSRSDANEPHRLILDKFEEKAGRIPMLVGAVAANSLAFPNSAVGVMSTALAAPLAAIGGAFGCVYGFTQVKKAGQLSKQLLELKAQGVEQFDMPRWSRGAIQTHTVNIDQAIGQVKRGRLGGLGQLLGSGMLMAAGCTGFAPLAVAGLVVSTAVGLAAVGCELYARRQSLKDSLSEGWHKVQARFKTPVAAASPQGLEEH